jgi:transcriptional regulator with XRE-family HTH domain
VKVHNNLRLVIFQKAVDKTKTFANLAKTLNVSRQNLSRYKLGQRDIPFQKFEELLDFIGTNLQAVENEVEFKIGRLSKFYLKPSVEITPGWVYIAELIRSDGYIDRNMWSCQFINGNEKLLRCFVSFF